MQVRDKYITSLEEVYSELNKDEVEISDIYKFKHKKTSNRVKNLSLGRIWFNLLLPEDYPLTNQPMTKSDQKKLIDKLLNRYDVKQTSETVSFINKEAFKLGTLLPQTFESKDLIVPPEILEKRDKLLTKDTPIEEFIPILESLAKEYIEKYLTDTGFGNIIESGAKGSPLELAILQLAKGPTIDIEDNITHIITKGLSEGYDVKDYYAAGGEARRNLYIRGVGTQDPGYLARNVTHANSNIIISESNCRTRKLLTIQLKPSMIDMVIGRYIEDPNKKGSLIIITEENKDKFVNKTVRMRSPLYCKSQKGICETCYGITCKKLDTKHVGLLAASAVNRVGIEGFAMKARHQATQVNLKKVNFIEDQIQLD